MGIHARDNVSAYAHQEVEPDVPDHYSYDQYVIVDTVTNVVMQTFDMGSHHGAMWNAARKRFLHLYNVDKRPVRLVGQVFN